MTNKLGKKKNYFCLAARFSSHRAWPLYSEWISGYGRGACRVYTLRLVSGQFLVNAEGFWGERGIFRAAFTTRMRRVAFSCKRGGVRGEEQSVRVPCLGGMPRLHLDGGVGAISCKRGRVLGRKGYFSCRVYTWDA